MSDYAIGDVQGCYDPLMRLLEEIDFNERKDQLWFAGDLVNRGPQSLEVLHFIKSLTPPAKITLGNHDLHLLSCIYTKNPWRNTTDTLDTILKAPDCLELGEWLRHQSVICYSETLSVVLTHAGIAPCWDLDQALSAGKELEKVLSGSDHVEFLEHMFGNKPNYWSDDLTGIERLRMITNYFTRMRFCTTDGHLDFSYDGTLKQAPQHLIPWFQVPKRKVLDVDLVFGHWAALMGICPVPKLYAIDTGCVWGGQLTALRLQDKEIFRVQGMA